MPNVTLDEELVKYLGGQMPDPYAGLPGRGASIGPRPTTLGYTDSYDPITSAMMGIRDPNTPQPYIGPTTQNEQLLDMALNFIQPGPAAFGAPVAGGSVVTGGLRDSLQELYRLSTDPTRMTFAKIADLGFREDPGAHNARTYIVDPELQSFYINALDKHVPGFAELLRNYVSGKTDVLLRAPTDEVNVAGLLGGAAHYTPTGVQRLYRVFTPRYEDMGSSLRPGLSSPALSLDALKTHPGAARPSWSLTPEFAENEPHWGTQHIQMDVPTQSILTSAPVGGLEIFSPSGWDYTPQKEAILNPAFLSEAAGRPIESRQGTNRWPPGASQDYLGELSRRLRIPIAPSTSLVDTWRQITQALLQDIR